MEFFFHLRRSVVKIMHRIWKQLTERKVHFYLHIPQDAYETLEELRQRAGKDSLSETLIALMKHWDRPSSPRFSLTR